ncbi:MAG: regulatory protein RecX [Oscillospiraceae bacterium]
MNNNIQITKISVTKQGRYALFCDEGFLFSLDENTFAGSGLHAEDWIEEEDLAFLRSTSDNEKARQQGLRYLSMREHGENELYQKLCRKYDKETAAAAVAALCKIGLVEDARFAGMKAQEMMRRGKSSREISQKLASLGISRDITEEAVDGLQIDDTAIAAELVEKKYTRALQRGETEKVKAALGRRGFSYDVIRKVVQNALQQIEDPYGSEDT